MKSMATTCSTPHLQHPGQCTTVPMSYTFYKSF